MGIIFGCDISLTCPGFAVIENYRPKLIYSQKSRLSGAHRWNEIAFTFEKILSDYKNIEGIVFEGYGFASYRLGDLAEIGGILRYLAYKHGKLYGSLPPKSLKKWFTGNGNADKKAMLAEAFKRGYLCANDNEADAVALALYGETIGFTQLNNLFQPTELTPKTPKLL